jgi:hypothetical protein
MNPTYDDSAYDDLIKDAERDDRAGDHDFLVDSVVHDLWPSGDPRTKIRGVLLTANGAKADLTLSPPPPPEVVRAESSGWTAAKKKAIAGAISLYRQLAKDYAKSPDVEVANGLTPIAEGDVFRVKTVITKRNDDGTGGFVRVIAFKSKAEVGAAGAAAETTPF